MRNKIMYAILIFSDSQQDIMNREKEDELPMMQVNFIDSICLPIYEVSIQAEVPKLNKD